MTEDEGDHKGDNTPEYKHDEVGKADTSRRSGITPGVDEKQNDEQPQHIVELAIGTTR
jgi:hypothetical protein